MGSVSFAPKTGRSDLNVRCKYSHTRENEVVPQLDIGEEVCHLSQTVIAFLHAVPSHSEVPENPTHYSVRLIHGL